MLLSSAPDTSPALLCSCLSAARAQEVKRIQSVPLVIGQFLEAVDENTGIVGSTTGNNYYVRILSTINREQLKPNASVALHRHSNALVEVRWLLQRWP